MVLVPWLCGSVNITANEIHIMKKRGQIFTVVLRGFVDLGIGQGTFKGGRKSVEATCC